MLKFMDNDFLLKTETSKVLYHNHAKKMPIFDLHNHLSAQEIYEDKTFTSITEAWLKFDHYKWRAMRTNGVDEHFITGDASDYEKFEKWAMTVPDLMGNPLYHWTHLELQRYFDIHEPLTGKNAKMIFDKCNEKLSDRNYSVRNIIRRSNVYALCTTDDPCDNLEYHKMIKSDGFETYVLPSFRADRIINIQKEDFISYVNKLEDTVNKKITNYSELENAILERVDYFNSVGCKMADHGLEEILFLDSTEQEVDTIFKKALNKEKLSRDEIRKYQGRIQSTLGKKYHKLNWTMQLHIGPMRNNSERNFKKLGPDTGFDSMMDGFIANDLSKLLNDMDKTESLPKTIIYCLNPKDNEVISTMLGNFQDGKTPGKIQFGTAWWFNDHKYGMIEHMKVLSATSLLSRFIGMLTDSRSFLSFTRHEYFRRILCNYIGDMLENGEYPNDIEYVSQMVENICFNNAKNYIKI